MKRKYLALLLLCLVLIAANGCASFIVNKGIASPRPESKIEKNNERNRERWEALVPGIMPWMDSLRSAGVMRDTFIVVDGCRLHALFAPAPQASRRTAIVVHGYNAGPPNIMMLARMYRDSLGFNVLTPSLRHHSYSEGNCVQMGWNDRLDVLKWAEIAHRHFDDTLQVLHGMSMGAATVMMASGEATPDYIRAFVEDCGYTSVWEEFNYISHHYLKRDSLLVQRIYDRTERKFDLDLSEASSVRQLAKCSKPMLFIHGDADKLVPVEMARKNYDAKTRGYKELWIVPGAAHSRAFPCYPEEYTERVRRFIAEHVLKGD